jgi:hypothetical protein
MANANIAHSDLIKNSRDKEKKPQGNLKWSHRISILRRIVSKVEGDVQKEIYSFIEEKILEGSKGVILQEILTKFCFKYKLSEPTITRYLEKMVAKKSPFRLRTWYDKNRYYTIPTVSVRFQAYFVLTLMLPVISFIIDSTMKLPVNVFIPMLAFFFGFWIAYISEKKKNSNNGQ